MQLEVSNLHQRTWQSNPCKVRRCNGTLLHWISFPRHIVNRYCPTWNRWSFKITHHGTQAQETESDMGFRRWMCHARFFWNFVLVKESQTALEIFVQRLSETRPRRFTAAQVEDKLNEIQSQTMEKTRKGTIFTEGLKVLSKLSHDERVNYLRQQLEDELLAAMMREKIPRLRSQSHGAGSSRSWSRKHLTPAEIPESPSPRRVLSTASKHKTSSSKLSSRESVSPLARRRQFAAEVGLMSDFWILLLLFA